MGEARRAVSFGRQPLQFNLNGTRLVLALQEAGVDMKKLDLKHLLEGSGADVAIQEVESRLESARAADWNMRVSVVVEY